MRTVLMSLLLLTNYTLLPAQMFEQVYPEFEYAELRGGTQWSGDTFYLCGLNQMLLRSTDAGATWQNEMAGRRDWCFYDIAATDEALYLLGEPTVFWNGTLPTRQIATLLHYDPRTASLDLVEIPRLPASGDEDPTSIHDLTAAGGALFLLQGNFIDGLLLHRSMDGGRNWTEVRLPDSLVGEQSAVCCRDSAHVALVVRKTGGTWGALTTTNGGITWSFGVEHNVEKNGLLWLSDSELVAIEHEGSIMYSADGGAHWEERSLPPTSMFFDAATVDGNRGYILGGFGQLFRSDDGFRTFVDIGHDAAGQYLILGGMDTLVNVGSRCDNIYVTHDGGISWDFIRKAERQFWELRMASDLVGVALVENIYDDSYAYYKTSDGWESMILIMDQSHPMFPKHYIGCRMYPVTESLWYMVPPILPEHKWLVHKSTDGGENWEDILLADDLGDIPMSGGINVVDIPDTNYFGIILEHNLVWTSDRGNTWQVSNLLNQSTFSYQMQLRPFASSWMISGDGVFGRDTVWRCESGWENWDAILIDPDTVGARSHFRQIQITPQGDVLILAEFDSPLGHLYDWSYMYRSTDDGQNWELYPTSFDMDGYSVMTDGSALVLSAPELQTMYNRTSGGALHRSTDGWKHYTTQDVLYQRRIRGFPLTTGRAIYVCDRHSIFRNLTNGINGVQTPPQASSGLTIQTPWPHPLRRGTSATIQLQLKETGQNLNVTLHDMLGRQQRTLYNATASSEQPVIPWWVHNLVPGLYILRVQYGDVLAVKPVVVE